MKIIYASGGVDFKLIKELGFDTLLGCYSLEQLDKMKEYNLSCIYHGDFIDHVSIIAYYLYDEPDVNKISIEEQELKIQDFKVKTNKPLAIALIEEVERKCSINFDWYLMDIYYSNKLNKFKNYLNIAISSQFIKILYKGKRIMPIIGLYDDYIDFTFTPEIKPFGWRFRSYFNTNDFAIFYWNSSPSNNGVSNVFEYQIWAKEFTSKDNKYSLLNYICYPLAYCFLKVNPLLGKFKITI